MLVELEAGGTALSGGDRGPRRGDGDRRGPAQRGQPPDACTRGCAAMPTAAWPPWPTRARSPRAARTRWPRSSRPGSSSCAGRTRAGDRAPSALNSPRRASTPVPGRSSIYRTLVRHHLIEPTPRKRRTLGLQALGAQPVDGAVADGHRRALPSRRRHRGQGRHRHRRPLTVLRLCPGGGPGDGPSRCAKRCSGRCAPTGSRSKF